MLQDMHPLSSANIPHPSTTLHSNTANNIMDNTPYQDHNNNNNNNTIDFISNDPLSFVPPISQASPIYEFEDLHYQLGLASYQKNHMAAFRHSSSMTSPTPMSIQSSMPINIKPEPISNYGFYHQHHQHHLSHPPHHNEDDSFPLSAPANIGHHPSSFDLSTSTSDGYQLNHHLNSSNNNNNDHHHHMQAAFSTSPHESIIYQQQQHQIHQHPSSLDGTQSPGSQPRSFEDDYSIQVNMQAMMDKRRRRRESHNAVERRRRENINERIQELGTLLPDLMTDTTKPNKGAILRKSVDHIRQLQQEVNTYSQRVKELENTLKKLQAK
ncbi:unnamed protein product [Cunninghamella blakesleeana]